MSEASLILLTRMVDEVKNLTHFTMWDREEREWSLDPAITTKQLSDALAKIIEINKMSRDYLTKLACPEPTGLFPPRLWPHAPMTKEEYAKFKARTGR